MPTVEEAIRAARDQHPHFTRERHTDGMLVRAASRYQRRLHGRLADADPDLLYTEEPISFPLTDHEAGQVIPTAHLRVTGGEVRFPGALAPAPLHIQGVKWRYRSRPQWSVEIVNGTMRPMGDAQDWLSVSQVVLRLWPVPTELEARTSEIDLPGDPLDVVAGAMAELMASRLALPGFGNALREEDYIDQVTGRRRAKVGTVKEVY